MARIIKQIEVLNPKKVKPNWELVYEKPNLNIDRLIEVYKENPIHARILVRQTPQNYIIHRVVSFMYDNGDINVVHFEKKFGISISNRMYNSEKNISSIIYKKETNKWYIKKGGRILNLNYIELQSFATCVSYSPNDYYNIIEYIIKMIPWVRNIKEDKYNASHKLIFNTIISKKLFNLKSIYRHLYGIPYPVITMMNENITTRRYGMNISHFLIMWKEMKKVLINVENLKVELFGHDIFMDTCKMAASVGEKINCSWGINRLKEEHDKWTKEISNVLLFNEEKTNMNIYHVYEEFSNYSGYEILRTNYDMIYDGIKMSHCVGTYIKKVNSGQCGIYKVGEYTLELGINNFNNDNIKILYLVQIKGYKNSSPPKEVVDGVLDKLRDFNNNIIPKIKMEEMKDFKYEMVYDFGLPF